MPRKAKTAEAPTEMEALQQENDALRSVLSTKYAEASAVAIAKDLHEESKMVVIENCSSATVGIPYEYLGRKHTLMLDTSGIRQQGALPLEVWIGLERESKLVSEGYIRRTDRLTSNPNVIVDIAEFVTSIRESDMTSRVAKITNVSVLYRLYNWLEAKERDQRSGKEVKLMETLRTRLFETAKVRIIDGDIE